MSRVTLCAVLCSYRWLSAIGIVIQNARDASMMSLGHEKLKSTSTSMLGKQDTDLHVTIVDHKVSGSEHTKSKDTNPKYAYPPHGRPLIWQRPKGEVKGILLYMNGCGGLATDMFTPEGHDGFKLEACDKAGEWGAQCKGKKAEMATREGARKKGYLVATVQGGTGMNSRRCTNQQDIPKIKTSLQYLRQQEDLMGKRVILMGFSSGGRTVPELAHYLGASAQCSVIVANEVRQEATSSADLGIPPGYPTKTPIIFVHMPHDDKRIGMIKKNIRQFKASNVKTAEIQVGWGQKHHMAGGAYMDEIINWCESGKVPAEGLRLEPPPGYVDV